VDNLSTLFFSKKHHFDAKNSQKHVEKQKNRQKVCVFCNLYVPLQQIFLRQ